MELTKLSTIIVNPDPDGRSRLKEIIKNCIHKANLHTYSSTKDAIKGIKRDSRIDVIFLSLSLEPQTIKAFIAEASSRLNRTSPLFILTLDDRSVTSMTRATSLYLEGVSGFVAEPFSVDDIQKLLIAVYEHQKKIDQMFKRKKSIELLLNEAIQILDPLTIVALNENGQPGTELRDLRRISASIDPLYTLDPALYIETALEIFEAVPAPSTEPSSKKSRADRGKVLHPSRAADDIMNKRKLSFEQLSLSGKVTPEDFKGFLLGERPVTDELATELARLFGGAPKDWTLMQERYDFFQQRIKQREKLWQRKAQKAET